MARAYFLDQLRQLGYNPNDLGDGKVCFPYTVPVGRFCGQEVQLGFRVGDDFPLNPPSGPHVSPRLLPLNQSSNRHPEGGVHASEFGADWEYWSRPFPGWAGTDRTVKTYMAHIRHLFATQ